MIASLSFTTDSLETIRQFMGQESIIYGTFCITYIASSRGTRAQRGPIKDLLEYAPRHLRNGTARIADPEQIVIADLVYQHDKAIYLRIVFKTTTREFGTRCWWVICLQVFADRSLWLRPPVHQFQRFMSPSAAIRGTPIVSSSVVASSTSPRPDPDFLVRNQVLCVAQRSRLRTGFFRDRD